MVSFFRVGLKVKLVWLFLLFLLLLLVFFFIFFVLCVVAGVSVFIYAYVLHVSSFYSDEPTESTEGHTNPNVKYFRRQTNKTKEEKEEEEENSLQTAGICYCFIAM